MFVFFNSLLNTQMEILLSAFLGVFTYYDGKGGKHTTFYFLVL